MAEPLPQARTDAPPAPWDGLARILQPFFLNRMRGVLSIVGGLAIWEFFSRVVVDNALFLAAPTQIMAALWKLTETGELQHHIGISALEFALGFVIASVLGIALGVGMASSVTIKQTMQPWVSGIYATPTIALAPLFILWFGIGIWSKVIVVVTLVLFSVSINTEAGLRQTSDRLIEMLRSFGASAAADLLEAVIAVGDAVRARGLEARHRPRPHRRGGGRTVRLARGIGPSHQPIGRQLQHAGAVRRRRRAGGCRHRHDGGLFLARGKARAVDQGLSMESKLSVSALSKRFGDLEALRDIGLGIGAGEFVSIVGPSGCGKTTFLRIVAGLEPASAGEVRIDGRPVTSPGADRGFVFQQDSLLPWRTVFANAMIGPEIGGNEGEREKRRTLDLLKLVGLAGFEDYFPRQLSGGMRQRVNLARALAIDPQILLMDEPFSALDAQSREIMQTELLRIWEQGRKTVIFVTHQIDEAVFLSDRVFVFARRPGRLQDRVEIDLPRPRTLALKRTPEFVAYVDRIWKLIENDVRDSVLHEHV